MYCSCVKTNPVPNSKAVHKIYGENLQFGPPKLCTTHHISPSKNLGTKIAFQKFSYLQIYSVAILVPQKRSLYWFLSRTKVVRKQKKKLVAQIF